MSKTATPPFPLVRAEDQDSVQNALMHLNLWEEEESIELVELAGAGNMNLVIRVVTNHRRLILKQSRPWVEKYPQIAAPADRILAEIDFYERVSGEHDVVAAMPAPLASCREHCLLALEDLGSSSDYTDLYQRRRLVEFPLTESLRWLVRLHEIKPAPGLSDSVGNRALRQLNHAHIFSIPFQNPSAIELDPICGGLEELAVELRRNAELVDAAERLGNQYLQTGRSLLHGDFYPGSWLRTDHGFRVIDPEFTFAGPIEFDLGVVTAHCVLMGGDLSVVDSAVAEYSESGGSRPDSDLLCGFAGVEIIRRLIGVAQLPLQADLDERRRMIRCATELLCVGNSAPRR